jgi:hypothetical protein
VTSNLLRTFIEPAKNNLDDGKSVKKTAIQWEPVEVVTQTKNGDKKVQKMVNCEEEVPRVTKRCMDTTAKVDEVAAQMANCEEEVPRVTKRRNIQLCLQGL